MRAGLLRHRVTIQTRTETQGSAGDVTWTWSDLDTVWASIEPLMGSEAVSAKQLQSRTDTRIRIRYRHGLTTKMRIKWEEPGSPIYTRYYEIEAILNPRQNHRETVLMCVEREAGGMRD